MFHRIPNQSAATVELLSRACKSLEFFVRLLFVNVPSYFLAHSPELDQMCAIVFAYLTLQVVGFCWAFLINACFALACRVPRRIVDPLSSLDGSSASSSSSLDGIDFGDVFTNSRLIQLMSAFYVSYASIRVVMNFGQAVLHIALESIKDYPDASKRLATAGMSTLRLAPVAFIPVLILEVALVGADSLCGDMNGGTNTTTLSTSVGSTSWFDGSSWSSIGSLSSVVSFFSMAMASTCEQTGLFYLTSQYPNIRRVVFYSLVVVTLQLWQTFLHQFPRWDMVFRSMNRQERFLLQVAVVVLVLGTVVAFSMVALPDTNGATLETLWNCFLLGWNVWLCLFVPHIVSAHGEEWTRGNSVSSMQTLAAYLRLSQIVLIATIFFAVCYFKGFLQAQLDLTFITIVLPTLCVSVYLLAAACLRAGSSTMMMWGLVASLAGAVTVCRMANAEGKGSVLLVMLHMLGKLIVFYGEGEEEEEEEEEEEDYGGLTPSSSGSSIEGLGFDLDSSSPRTATSHKNSISCSKSRSMSAMDSRTMSVEVKAGSTASKKTKKKKEINKVQQVAVRGLAPPPSSSSSSSSVSSSLSMNNTAHRAVIQRSTSLSILPDHTLPLSSSPSETSVLTGTGTGLGSGFGSTSGPGGLRRNRSEDALRTLSERGQRGSTLVSLGLSPSVSGHWVVRTSRTWLAYLLRITRTLVVPESPVSAVLRLFGAIAVVLTLILSTISIASLFQQSLRIFPRFIDFTVREDGGYHIDHRIVNVTLHPRHHHNDTHQLGNFQSKRHSDSYNCPAHRGEEMMNECSGGDGERGGRGGGGGGNADDDGPAALTSPYYSVCHLRWKKELSVLDFALLSELAYFDDEDDDDAGDKPEHHQIQAIVDTLFPHLDLRVRGVGSGNLQGPMYLEVVSDRLRVVVLAVRGTDIGRLHDFMEDVKLYAEPVIFSLLSSVFPTIRYWSHDTTSRVIEGLFEFNSFFGLQGESDYYRPLVQRVVELSDDADAGVEGKPYGVVITGHSLGGGLARIVGTLTSQPSVSFSPPGLGLSYRKYSSTRPDGSVNKITSHGALHHESVAVITEFDWITQVDEQVGLVQRILCDRDDKAHQNGCHLLEGTICHLLQHCGDPADRFQSCDYNYDIGAVAPALMGFLSLHRWIVAPVLLSSLGILLLAVIPDLL